MLDQSAELRSLRERYGTLSRREREVMALVAAGRLNKQVGGELGISEITVKAHRGRVMQKMCAKSCEDRYADTDEFRQHIDECFGAMDRGESRSEFKRMGLVIGAIVLVVAVVIYFLSR